MARGKPKAKGAERDKGKRLSPIGLALAWGWLALVTVYLSWGAATERGLYGWLMRWQVERGDTYSGTLTAALPIVILGLPGIWTLFGHFQAVEAAAAGKPDAERRYMRTWALWLLGLAGLSLAIGLFSIAMAAQAPGYQEPVEIDAADILAGRAPAGRLRMMAHPVRHARYEMTELGRRGTSEATSWQGVRPLTGPMKMGEPDPTAVDPAEPVALFTEGSIRRGLGERRYDGRLGDRIQITGHAIENGLPELARRGLARQGVRIAEPHYVLRDEEEGANWMVGVGLGLFGAFVLGFIGGAMLLKSEGKLGLGPGEAIR